MCEGSTPTLPFCDAQGSENPAPPFITDVRSSSREAASQSSRSNFRAVTDSLAVPFHHITHLGHFLPHESAWSHHGWVVSVCRRTGGAAILLGTFTQALVELRNRPIQLLREKAGTTGWRADRNGASIRRRIWHTTRCARAGVTLLSLNCPWMIGAKCLVSESILAACPTC